MISFLSNIEMAEALKAENRAYLIIGGQVINEEKRIVFWRGDGSEISSPFIIFTTSGDGTAPDFNKFSVIDYGNTVKFGKYEASSRMIIEDFLNPEILRARTEWLSLIKRKDKTEVEIKRMDACYKIFNMTFTYMTKKDLISVLGQSIQFSATEWNKGGLEFIGLDLHDFYKGKINCSLTFFRKTNSIEPWFAVYGDRMPEEEPNNGNGMQWVADTLKTARKHIHLRSIINC